MGVLKNGVGRPSNETIRKRNLIKIMFAILILVIIGLIGYILVDKNIITINGNKNPSKDDTPITTEQNKEEMDIESKEVEDLYTPFSYFMHEASEEELYKKDALLPSDLSNEYKNRLAFAYMYNKLGYDNVYDGKNKLYDDSELEFRYLKSSKLEKYYTEFFGKDVKYNKVSFNSYSIDTNEMTYNSKDDSYYEADFAGDFTPYRYAHELYKAVKSGNKIELYEYVVVYNQNDNDRVFGVYKNIEDANNHKNAIKEELINDNGDYNLIKIKDKELSHQGVYADDLSGYKDEASKYKITFEKENSNYVFKKIEKIN